jgi:hypothetical protein
MAVLLAQPPAADLDPIERITEHTRQFSQAYLFLQEMVSVFRHRLTGSTNGKLVEDYTYHLFGNMGYDKVRFQSFEAGIWQRDSVLCQIKWFDGSWQTFPSVALAHTPLAADITGSLIDVGSGLAADWEKAGEKVKGKIALVYLGVLPVDSGNKNLHRSEKTAYAIKTGAKGIIFYNNARSPNTLLTGTASLNGKLISIPAICISRSSGESLIQRMKDSNQEITARIFMRNRFNKVQPRNVIAILPGSEKPDEKVVIGAHLDSWDLAPCAIDNGLGTVAVLDIARMFKRLGLRPQRTIEFVLFMGEEQGLLGSKHYIKSAIEDHTIQQVRYMINLDMTNAPQGLDLGKREEMRPIFVALNEKLKKSDSTYTGKLASNVGLHSDHQPFLLAGIPIAGIEGYLAPEVLDCYHADCDNIHLANDKEMRATVRVAASLLWTLANENPLPAVRWTPKKTQEVLQQAGLKSVLELRGEWSAITEEAHQH